MYFSHLKIIVKFYTEDQLFGSDIQRFMEETKKYKNIKMSDYDSNNEMAVTVETRGNLYEPECTEELLQWETEWAKREQGETSLEIVWRQDKVERIF